MASGYGFYGGSGRCFAYWQEFHKCYAMADRPDECVLQRDDYLECLHHTKEIKRFQQIQSQQVKQIEARRKAEEASRKYSDAAAKSNVQRLGIIEEKAAQQPVQETKA
ncbi:uncharacterized protein VTP21DRAFT_3109 [Calcarisporiella thermophila]|uniref:uncharacterized protein n=1 Tax=Calcarisporiella thermophila TaxID=911321 RepID=UPI003742D84B